MATLDPYSCWLQRVAIVFAVANIFSVFACDLREWFVYFDPPAFRFGVLPTFVVGLPALPFLIPLKQHSTGTTAVVGMLALVSAALLFFEGLWIVQIVIATFFRGPDWNFYWPWEQRLSKSVPLNTLDLSEYFWINLLGQSPRPVNLFKRETAGLAFICAHFIFVPLLGFVVLRRSRALKLDWKAVVFVLLLQLLVFFFLKVALRWMFNVKYVLFWPEVLNV